MKETLEAAIKEAVELANKHAADSESLKIAAAEMRGRAQALQQTLATMEARSEQEDTTDAASEEAE